MARRCFQTIAGILLAGCALICVGPSGTADAATGATEITSHGNAVVVDQMVAWLKKNLALTAAQVEDLVKRAGTLRAASDKMSEPALSDELNKLLTESRIGGIQILNRHDPLFWLYRERFGLTGPEVPPQVPAWLTRRGRNWHVYLAANVPGRTEGTTLARGDEIIFESGEPFDFSAGDKSKPGSGQQSVQIKSLAHEKAVSKAMPFSMKSTSQLLLDIVQSNARTVALPGAGNKAAGYLPLPTADIPALREAYISLMNGFAKNTDALIVDLRGPYGEGGLSGIDLFLSDKGERQNFTKKLFVLTDRNTAGGREALATMLQRHAGAVLVGEPSAGISAPVDVADLDPGRFLLIATQDGKEGFGPVQPDFSVVDTLAYVAGRDDVLDRALSVAAKDLR